MHGEHQDFRTLNQIRTATLARCGGEKALAAALPNLIADAVDFVVDPVRTARTLISELDNVEKTFIGLKIEHYLRDFLDFPKGIRDLRIGDMDVDVKTTVRNTWMIPPETFRNAEPCLLILTATEVRFCSMGLILARDEYLNRPNRDGKRSVKASAFADILWLVEREPLPESRWSHIDMTRFRDLRKVKGGTVRAAAFFSGKSWKSGPPVNCSGPAIRSKRLHEAHSRKWRGSGCSSPREHCNTLRHLSQRPNSGIGTASLQQGRVHLMPL